MDSWAKHEKSTLDVKEQRTTLDDDWGAARVRVDAEHLQVETEPRCGLWMKVFLILRFFTFCTAMMIGIGEFFVS